jgi:hypothetical protein
MATLRFWVSILMGLVQRNFFRLWKQEIWNS